MVANYHSSIPLLFLPQRLFLCSAEKHLRNLTEVTKGEKSVYIPVNTVNLY